MLEQQSWRTESAYHYTIHRSATVLCACLPTFIYDPFTSVYLPAALVGPLSLPDMCLFVQYDVPTLADIIFPFFGIFSALRSFSRRSLFPPFPLTYTRPRSPPMPSVFASSRARRLRVCHCHSFCRILVTDVF
ncbi:hypothetical protein L226DRAFT_277271 [Lentinus tigrinus ALCF2SS1-7]|uniref:uncharacterized protein n=1 Tax=Lentinus tigrinus ALCF2SS1-7 TaxID=1328758 RepID=UPI00116632E4|nr:hypothetical protein L226DRAFT_277271 [Lentinus tigrinus ALCF2SS1-7]